MKKVLIDEKGYEAKTNCEDVFANGDILFAGEDGLIKIIEKENLNNSENPKEKYLEKMLDRDGWLANIEEIKILENGNIVCVETLGSVGISIFFKSSSLLTVSKALLKSKKTATISLSLCRSSTQFANIKFIAVSHECFFLKPDCSLIRISF